ncbi:MAG: type II toxin-antitoxin system VapB family antitoxin [Firmicutes bacterium]|nr:type II toxin-antitoxin system VapB family antitoxin [Bacillota bacterium]
MDTAKVFSNGRSQAIRLPKEYRFQDAEVYVKKLDGIVILIPRSSPWQSLLAGLEDFSTDFLADRAQPPTQVRDDWQ